MPTIPVDADCPTCVLENKGRNRLMQSLDTGKVFCKEGHEFLDFEQVENATQPPPLEAVAAEPTPNLESVPGPGPGGIPREILEPVTEPAAELAPPPEEIITVEAPIPQDLGYAPEPNSGTTADPVQRQNQTTLPAPSPASVEAPKPTAPPAPTPSPGGYSVYTFHMVDWADSMLKAEAEVQNKSPQHYFQEVVQYGIEQGWFFALPVAKRG